MYPKFLAAMLAALWAVLLPASAVEVNFEFLETKPGEWDVLAEVIPEGGDTLGIAGYAFNIIHTDSEAVIYEPSRLNAIMPETFQVLGFANPAIQGVVRGNSADSYFSPYHYYSVGHSQATVSGQSEILNIGIKPIHIESLSNALEIGSPALLGKLKTPLGLSALNFERPELSLFPDTYSGLQNTQTFGIFHDDPNFNFKVMSNADLNNQASYAIEFNEVERGVFDVMATINPRQTGIQGIAGYSFNLSGPGGIAASVSQPGLSAIDPATSTPVGFPAPTLSSTANSQSVSSSQATSGGTSELFGFGINPVSFDGLGGNDIQAGVPVRLSRITVPEGAGQLDFSDLELSLFAANYDGTVNSSLLRASVDTPHFLITENRLPPKAAPRTTPSLYPRLTEISPGVWEVSARISEFSSGTLGISDYSFEVVGANPRAINYEQGTISTREHESQNQLGFSPPKVSVQPNSVIVSGSQLMGSSQGEIFGFGIDQVELEVKGESVIATDDRVVLGTLYTPRGLTHNNFSDFSIGIFPKDYESVSSTAIQNYSYTDDNLTLDVIPFRDRSASEIANVRFVERTPGEWQVYLEADANGTSNGLAGFGFSVASSDADKVFFKQGNLFTVDPEQQTYLGFSPVPSTSLTHQGSRFGADSHQIFVRYGEPRVVGIGIKPISIDGEGPNDIDVDSPALLGTLYTEPGLGAADFTYATTRLYPFTEGDQGQDLRNYGLDRPDRNHGLLTVSVFPYIFYHRDDYQTSFAGDVSLTDDSMLSPVDGGSEIQSRTTTVVVDDGIVRMALSVTLSGYGADGLPLAVQANSEGQLGVGDGVLDAGEAIAVHYNSVEFSLVEGADPSLVDLDRVRAEFSGFGVAGDFADDEDTVQLDGLATDQFDTLATGTGSLLGLQQSSAITPGLSFTITAQSGGFGLQSLAHLISYDQTAVPEPASLALATLATAALVFTTRHKISRR